MEVLELLKEGMQYERLPSAFALQYAGGRHTAVRWRRRRRRIECYDSREGGLIAANGGLIAANSGLIAANGGLMAGGVHEGLN